MKCPLSFRMRVTDVYAKANSDVAGFWNAVNSDMGDLEYYKRQIPIINDGLSIYRNWCYANGIMQFTLEGIQDMWVPAGFYLWYRISFTNHKDASIFRRAHTCFK